MTKWKLRMPDMYQSIPERGFTPRSGIAILVALLLYLIYSVLSALPQGVQAVLWFVPRTGAGGQVFDLMEDYIMDSSTLLTALYSFALLIIVTAFYIRIIEKRPLSTIGLSRGRIVPRYLLGVGVGLLILVLTVWPAFVLQEVKWRGFTSLVPLFLGAFVIQGAAEEVLFRGMLMSGIARKMGVFWAVVLSSALFSMMHIATFEGLLYLLTLFMMGVLMAVLTIRTNSLWAAFGLHTAWNFASGLLVSGEAGGLGMNYAIFQIGDPNAFEPDFGLLGNPYFLYHIILFAIAISLVVFAGKNKPWVPRTEGEISLAGARRIAKWALPADMQNYAHAIGRMLRGDDEKAAVILCLAAERGVTPQAMAGVGVGPRAGFAALALARRVGDTEQARWERVQANPVAATVFRAQSQYTADCYAAQWHAWMALHNPAVCAQRPDSAGYGTALPPYAEPKGSTE